MDAVTLKARFVVRHSSFRDLKGVLDIAQWEDLAAEFYIRPDTLRGDSLIIPNNNRLLTIGGNDRVMTISRRRRIKVTG